MGIYSLYYPKGESATMPRPYKRSRTGSQVSVPMSIASQVSKKVKRAVNASKELKSVESSIQVSPTTTATNTRLSLVSQGDNVYNRDGNKIRARQLKIAGQVTAADNSNQVRLIVYKKNNSQTDMNVQANAWPSAISYPDYDIYFDKLIGVQQTSLGTFTKVFKATIPLGFDIRYNDTTTTSDTHNGLYLMYVSDSSAVTHPLLDFGWRMTFNE